MAAQKGVARWKLGQTARLRSSSHLLVRLNCKPEIRNRLIRAAGRLELPTSRCSGGGSLAGPRAANLSPGWLRRRLHTLCPCARPLRLLLLRLLLLRCCWHCWLFGQRTERPLANAGRCQGSSSSTPIRDRGSGGGGGSR